MDKKQKKKHATSGKDKPKQKKKKRKPHNTTSEDIKGLRINKTNELIKNK